MNLDKENSAKLTERVAFRLTKGDYDFYKSKVTQSGLNPSEYFRVAVLTNTTQILNKQHSQDKKHLIYLMNKTSNNINQLAHRINADHLTGFINDGNYIRLLNALERISDHLKAVVDHAD